MRLSVIGTGYLGATHAACMADLGHEVIGLDVDAAKVAALNAGQVPFHEPGLPEVLTRALASGRLRFTTSFAEAADGTDVHFICVGTPQRDDTGAADLSQVDAAIAGLAPHLSSAALVVGKSTVPVGTAQRLRTQLANTSPAGTDVELAWNPEFLREGFAIADTVSPDRLVFGVTSADAETTLRQVYAPLLSNGVPLVVTDLPTAELVKTAANAFLATKISFINAMAELCEAAGGDVVTLAQAIGHDERIGRRFLQAGLGFGGGCLPKDIRAFRARARELGVGSALDFLDDVDAVNLRCRTRTASAAQALVGGELTGVRVAALGAAFKPDSDDVRDSPALDVVAELLEHGADVVVHDPAANTNAADALPKARFVDTIDEAVQNADLVMLLTEWKQFVALDPEVLAAQVTQRRIVDARNVLDPVRWADAGWTIHSLGRGVSRPA
jgi:UDPglucose 6-dehydrogenase